MPSHYPSGVVNSIIERLHSEAVRQIGVTDELSGLEKTISSIKDVLTDAEEKQRADNAVKRWLERLEDAVYEAEELVDKLSYEALRQQRAGMLGRDSITRKVCTFFSTSLNQVALHDKLGHKIKAINKRLAAIRDDRVFALEKNIVGTGGKEPTPSCVPEDEVIGMESDKMAIKRVLLNATIGNKEDVQVIAIIGMGGIGKATLAKLAYNDAKVVEHFDLRLWVDFSRNPFERFDIRKIFKAATKKDFENLDTDQLKEKLGKIVRGKRCLLVLNDLFEGVDLKPLLLGCNNGSRVIITSRNLRVARTMGTMPPYMLPLLSEEQSWDLFKRMAFMNRWGPINSEIEKKSWRIISEVSGGNRFLIRAIGRMFSLKNPNTEWSSLLEMLECRHREAPDYFAFFGILQFLYENLPSHLKQCLAYCSVFPEGSEIDVETLINLWMAQGFIYSSPTKHILEDVGYEYFQYLYWLCFFEEVEKDEKGIARKCRMSFFMHDVVNCEAERISVRLYEEGRDGIDRRKTQHVSFDFHLGSSSQVPTSLVEANRIRTILLNNQMLLETEGTLSQSICDKIVSNCKLLRVLDLHSTGIEMVPVSIGVLKHLRYLDVSHNTAIKSLPNSITMLLHLTVLKLSSCYGLQDLPRDIQKLVSLRHLEIDWCYSLTHLPRGLGRLTQLQTLSEFVLNKANRDSCSLSELAELNNLRGKLKVKNLENGIYDSEAAILKEKEHLTSLTLAWDSDVPEDRAKDQLDHLEPPSNIKELALVRYEGIEFSNWLSLLNNLVKFSLRNCKCQHLPPLSQLLSLKVLMLDQMTDLKYISSEYENGHSSSSAAAAFFPSLEELRLTELPNLEGWWGGDNSLATASSLPSFPRLSKLMIEDCPKLSSMPLYTHLTEWLVLDNTRLETFQCTMNASSSSQVPSETNKEWSAASTSSAVCSSSSLSRLQSLCIIGIKKLDITYSDKIRWEGLRDLRFLRFDYLPKLKKLPEGLQQVTTLQELHIWRCHMETLPEWIGNFKLLKVLGISVCLYLNSLPEAIKSLSSLITLEIVDCPILLERCKRETGADWHKIEHIPDLLLK